MTLKQFNVEVNMKKDLDFGEKLKRLTPIQAFEQLYSEHGDSVFAKFEVRETSHVKGCRKCKKQLKKGNFCSECGSKLTDKLEVTKVTDTKWIGLHMDELEEGDGLWISDSHPYAGGRSFTKCKMSLEYFMSIKYWYGY